jgi:lipopolysaccharide export system permease protein
VKVIDYYIGKRFFLNFFLVLGTFILIFNLIHWVDHTGKYAGAPMDKILLFYLYNIPQVINLVIPVAGLLAALITYSNLGKYRELIALQVAGVSKIRYMMPALILSFIFSFLLIFMNELFAIELNNERQYIERVEILGKRPLDKKVMKDLLFKISNDDIVQIGRVDFREEKLYKFNLQTIENRKVIERIDADTVTWNSETRKWILRNPILRKISEDSVESMQKLDSLELKKLVFSLKDLKEPKFKPDRLERYMTLKQLRRFAEQRKTFGETTYHVDYEIYNAFFGPFSIFFMSFIGAALGSMFTRGGVMLYFLLTIIICLIYIVIVVVGKIMSQSNTISPFFGAMLPHLITLLVLLFISNKKA